MQRTRDEVVAAALRPRPAWAIQAVVGNGAKLLGRVPAGHASTAEQAIQWYRALVAIRHPGLQAEDMTARPVVDRG